MVAALGETTGRVMLDNGPFSRELTQNPAGMAGVLALQRLQSIMRADPVGRELLRERPQITEETLSPDYLRRLPAGSFGREYMAFMDHHT